MKALTQTEIRALYGFAPNQEVIAFGRSIKLKPTHVARQRCVEPTDFQCMADFWRAKEEQDAERARREARRATPELRSEVQELTF
jgi:hypothetical protein